MKSRSADASSSADPSPHLAAAEWVCHDVHLPGLPSVTDDACYRAMDQLITVEPALTRAIYDQFADLLNLEVDLLFFDTTSTYFELDEADDCRHDVVRRDEKGNVIDVGDPAAVEQAGFRTPRQEQGLARRPAPRSWSVWPSPAPAPRCGCGAGPAYRRLRARWAAEPGAQAVLHQVRRCAKTETASEAAIAGAVRRCWCGVRRHRG
jgi:hypothetical protein